MERVTQDGDHGDNDEDEDDIAVGEGMPILFFEDEDAGGDDGPTDLAEEAPATTPPPRPALQPLPPPTRSPSPPSRWRAGEGDDGDGDGSMSDDGDGDGSMSGGGGGTGRLLLWRPVSLSPPSLMLPPPPPTPRLSRRPLPEGSTSDAVEEVTTTTTVPQTPTTDGGDGGDDTDPEDGTVVFNVTITATDHNRGAGGGDDPMTRLTAPDMWARVLHRIMNEDDVGDAAGGGGTDATMGDNDVAVLRAHAQSIVDYRRADDNAGLVEAARQALAAVPPRVRFGAASFHRFFSAIEALLHSDRALRVLRETLERQEVAMDRMLTTATALSSDGARDTAGEIVRILASEMESLESDVRAVMEGVPAVTDDVVGLAEQILEDTGPVCTRLTEEEFERHVEIVRAPSPSPPPPAAAADACPGCPICLCDVGQPPFARLRCGHVGCVDCMRELLVRKCQFARCPVCRTDVRPPSPPPSPPPPTTTTETTTGAEIRPYDDGDDDGYDAPD